MKGTLKSTTRPFACAAFASRSSKLATGSTSAVRPSAGVPTLPPRPSTTRSPPAGSTRSRLSRPRTQCGTSTGSRRTFSSPSAFMPASAQRRAASSCGDPLRRWPKVSVSSASRSQARPSFRAAAIRRSAVSRYAETSGASALVAGAVKRSPSKRAPETRVHPCIDRSPLPRAIVTRASRAPLVDKRPAQDRLRRRCDPSCSRR